MSETTVDRPHPPAPPLGLGLAITGAVAFAVTAWIALGAYALKEPSYYVALVLFWYWTTVDQSDFRRLPSAFLGAAVGLAVTWAMKSLTGAFGWWGVALGGLLIAAVILADIMACAKIAFNGCTTLFLTVAGIPLVAGPTNFVEAGVALVVGTALLSLVAWVVINSPRWIPGMRRTG